MYDLQAVGQIANCKTDCKL